MTEKARCPKCGTPVKGGTDFGMETCANCGEFIMLGGMGGADQPDSGFVAEDEGEIQPAGVTLQPVTLPAMANEEEPLRDGAPANLAPVKTTVLDVNFDELNGGQELLTPELLAKTSMIPNPDMLGKTEVLPALAKTEVLAQPDIFPQEAGAGSGQILDAPLAGEEFASPVMADLDKLRPSPQQEIPPGPPQFADVVEFGNQEQPSMGAGGLVYDVEISGIETQEARKEILMHASDRRLQLNTEQIAQQMKTGQFKIENMNPVKASVFLSKLRHLPLKISWRSRQMIKSILIVALILTASKQVAAGEWARHESNLKRYATNIENMEDDIRALIVKKNKVKDPKERDEILKEIIAKNDELRKTYKEFKAEKEHVRFEHPEQGDNTERKYHHVKLKSLEDLEDELGVDGQLSRIKKKVEQTYPNAKASPSPVTSTKR